MRLSWKLFSFGFIFFSLIFLLWQPDGAFNLDLGEHIELGKIILATYAVPTVNLFSFSFPYFSWLPNSWLAAVLFYQVLALFGLNALLFLKILLILISFFILYIYAWKRYSHYWTFFIALIFICIYYIRFSLEPELFSYLFLAIFLLFIELYRKTKAIKYLLLLLPIEILWVNFHIYFIFGLAIYACFLIDQLFHKQNRKELLLIFIFLILSSLVNPMTYQGALFPFTIFHNYGGAVVENLSIPSYLQRFNFAYNDYLNAIYLYFVTVFLLIYSYFELFIRKEKILMYYLLLSILAVITGAIMLRLLPVFSFLSFIPLVANFTQIDKKQTDVNSIRYQIKISVLAVGIILVVIGVSITDSNSFGLSFNEDYKPAVDFIENHNIQGPMLNSYDNGSYLIYRLYPQQKVFIDGRNEAYPAIFTNIFLHMQFSNQQLFVKLDKQYHFNYIIYNNNPETTTTFINYLQTKNEWVPVYGDNYGNIIFLRNNLQNSELINKYRIHGKIEFNVLYK